MEERRIFLKTTGQILMGLAAVSVTSKTAPAATAENEKQPAMIIDVNRCTGCHSCVIACKEQNLTSTGNFNTRIDIKEQGKYPSAYQAFTPDLCHQCGNAPCAQACDFDAIFSLPSGIVVTDWDKCTGNGACVDACPYGARFLDQTNGNKADKCDFCLTRLDLALEPACVDACSSHARIFGDLAKPQGEFAEYLKLNLDRGDEQLQERVFHTIANKS